MVHDGICGNLFFAKSGTKFRMYHTTPTLVISLMNHIYNLIRYALSKEEAVAIFGSPVLYKFLSLSAFIGTIIAFVASGKSSNSLWFDPWFANLRK